MIKTFLAHNQKKKVVVTSDGEPCMVGLTYGFIQIFVNEAEYPVVQDYCNIQQKSPRTRRSSKKVDNILMMSQKCSIISWSSFLNVDIHSLIGDDEAHYNTLLM